MPPVHRRLVFTPLGLPLVLLGAIMLSGGTAADPPKQAAPAAPNSSRQESSGPAGATGPLAATQNARPASPTAHHWVIVRTSASRLEDTSRELERLTWSDPRIIKWLNEHATLLTINPDTDREAVSTLGLIGGLEIIAYRDDREFDRISGFTLPNRLLAWFGGLDRGETWILKNWPLRPLPSAESKAALAQRCQRAQDLARICDFDAAAAEFRDVWKAAAELDPDMSQAWVQPIVDGVRAVASETVAARSVFIILRDQLGERLDADAVDQNDLSHWLALNAAIDDHEAVLAWYERMRDVPRKPRSLMRPGSGFPTNSSPGRGGPRWPRRSSILRRTFAS